MASELATLTSKGQVTVPKTVRDALGLRQGDTLQWDLEDGSVRVKVLKPVDRLKLFTLNERLLLEPLGQLAKEDQEGVVGRLAELLAAPSAITAT